MCPENGMAFKPGNFPFNQQRRFIRYHLSRAARTIFHNVPLDLFPLTEGMIPAPYHIHWRYMFGPPIGVRAGQQTFNLWLE